MVALAEIVELDDVHRAELLQLYSSCLRLRYACTYACMHGCDAGWMIHGDQPVCLSFKDTGRCSISTISFFIYICTLLAYIVYGVHTTHMPCCVLVSCSTALLLSGLTEPADKRIQYLLARLS